MTKTLKERAEEIILWWDSILDVEEDAPSELFTFDDIVDVIKDQQARIAELEAKIQWLDIASVPKDGTSVLLMNNELCIAGEPSIIDDYWYQDRVMGGFDNWNQMFDVPPTHWMPLPEPEEV